MAALHFYLLALLSLGLPFYSDYFNHTGLLVILLGANAFVYWIRYRGEIRHKTASLIFCGVYLSYLISALMSQDERTGFFVLEKKLSIVVFPLVFSLSPSLSPLQLKRILLAFCAGCLMSVVVCFSVGFYHLVRWGDSAYLFYRIMSSTVGIHPAYLAMYQVTGILLLLYFSEQAAGKHRLFFLLATIPLIAFVVMLSVRTVFVVMVAVFILFLVRQMRRRFSGVKIITVVVLTVLIAVVLFLLPWRNRGRIYEIFKPVVMSDQVASTGASVRPYIWSCALRVFADSPVTGTGTGDLQNDLSGCYEDRGYIFLTSVKDMKFNAHNQLLEAGAAQGVVGLLALLLMMLYPLSMAVRNRNFLLFTFTLIFWTCCLTESMLERQAGIVFYAMFTAILLYEPVFKEGFLRRVAFAPKKIEH